MKSLFTMIALLIAVVGADSFAWTGAGPDESPILLWNIEDGQLVPSTLSGIPMWFQDIDDLHPQDRRYVKVPADKVFRRWTIYAEATFSLEEEGERILRVWACNSTCRLLGEKRELPDQRTQHRIGLFAVGEFEPEGDEFVLVQAASTVPVGVKGRVFAVWVE